LISVSRRYEIHAAHVLRLPWLGEEENRRLYGKCATVHGHDYGIEVTVTGRLDPRLGRLVDLERLDAVVKAEVVDRFDGRHLNEDPLFAERAPTAEHIAESVRALLAAPVARETGARLLRVRVDETRRNAFECGEPT
jgi:6-pyruvoyltetrahydropterin/6-carboxytetrahydropterin synthase